MLNLVLESLSRIGLPSWSNPSSVQSVMQGRIDHTKYSCNTSSLRMSRSAYSEGPTTISMALYQINDRIDYQARHYRRMSFRWRLSLRYGPTLFQLNDILYKEARYLAAIEYLVIHKRTCALNIRNTGNLDQRRLCNTR